VVVFKDLPKGLVSRRYAFEAGKGFSPMIDLRPDPDVRATPPRNPAGGRPERARERVREAPAPQDRPSPPPGPAPSPG
jgi:hypothetical protein